jgi:pimeloyl-ACP methyl ester carboxylesterase
MLGLLPRLAAEGIPAIGFSYQEGLAPVAPMPEAVAAAEKVALFAMERWNSERVTFVGYSRGGLVARHAAGLPSLAGKLDRLITLCTPHLGSGIADMAVRIDAQIGRFRDFARRWTGSREERAREAQGAFEEFLRLVTNLAGLSPESAEVRDAPAPEFPGGVFALAGNQPTYFRASIHPAPDFELPPRPSGWLPSALRHAEFGRDAGDGAVQVASALGYPGQDGERTLILPVNHMQASFDARTHDAVVRWLRAEAR